MHEAVLGRARLRAHPALAAGQLHAVSAFLDGGFDLHDGRLGVVERARRLVQGAAVATC
jgi:hypothetical protein